MELFLIGWKNVFRNKRRSVLNIIALSVGIIMMIFCVGWIRGYFTVLFNSIINFDTGHIQILKKGYLDENRRFPLDLNIDEYERLRELLLKDDRIKEVTGRINFNLKLSNGSDAIHLLVTAVDPVKESQVTTLKNYLEKGAYFMRTIDAEKETGDGSIKEHIESGSYFDEEAGILIGAPIAEKLKLKVNDTVYITAYDRYAVENFMDTRVVGIFNLGYPAMDNNVIFIDLKTAQSLLAMDQSVTRLVVKLKPGYSPEEVLPDIKIKLKNTDYEAYIWREFAKVLLSGVQADMGMGMIMGVVLYIFIIIGILNSMSMSVHERTQEIGTLRAMGMRKAKLIRLFLAESISIALISLVFSLIIGGALAAYMQNVGFDMSAFMPEDIPIPWGETFKADFKWFDFLLAVAFGTVTAIIGGIIPALRAAKITIAKAMHTAQV